MPKIKTKKLMVRGKTDREWVDIPAAGAGVYPVVKTDAMTAEIGRDAQGRLWAKESKKGVKFFGFGQIFHPDPSRPRGRCLMIGLEDETTVLVLIQDLARELGIDKIIAMPEYTEADEGKVLQIVGGKPVWVTLQSAPTPPAEEIALSINDDGSVGISGVVLDVQDDGAVLVGGAELALQDDGAVMIR